MGPRSGVVDESPVVGSGAGLGFGVNHDLGEAREGVHEFVFDVVGHLVGLADGEVTGNGGG